jgi:hypothetical protein
MLLNLFWGIIMTMKELGLTLRGLSLLVWPGLSVRPFVDDDYDAELKTNTQLAKEPAAAIEKRRREYEPEVRQRMGTFRWGVWGSFLFLLTAIIAAIILKLFWQASPNAKVWLGGASIFVFAWSTLARLGRSATSMGGKTALERVDLRVLWISYWFGTAFGTLALF